jgi:hypothetical protein
MRLYSAETPLRPKAAGARPAVAKLDPPVIANLEDKDEEEILQDIILLVIGH